MPALLFIVIMVILCLVHSEGVRYEGSCKNKLALSLVQNVTTR